MQVASQVVAKLSTDASCSTWKLIKISFIITVNDGNVIPVQLIFFVKTLNIDFSLKISPETSSVAHIPGVAEAEACKWIMCKGI